MRPDRRRFISGFAGVIGAMALPGGLAAAPLDRVRELGVLRIGLYADNRPWSWEQGGAAAGVDADLARAIAETLGVRADIALFTADEDLSDDLRNVVWRGGLLGFQACDVMLHVPFDMNYAKGQDQVVFVAPYCREGFAMICGSDARDCEAPPPLFQGKRLAAELETISDYYLLGGFGGVLRSDVRHYPTGYAAVSAVHTGEADMAVATRAQVEASMKDFADSGVRRRKGPLPALPSPGWDVGMAVKENSRSLGFAIEEIVEGMIGSGRMAEIFAAHGLSWQPALASQPNA